MARWEVDLELRQVFSFAIEADTASEAQTIASSQIDANQPDKLTMTTTVERGVS